MSKELSKVKHRHVVCDPQESSNTRVMSAAWLLARHDDPELARFAITYVHEIVETGDGVRAFQRAADAYAAPAVAPPAGPIPERRGLLDAFISLFRGPAARSISPDEPPPTRGRARLHRYLRFEPYCYRRTLTDVLDALGRLALRDRRVLPWLFEAGKLPYIEREIALKAALAAQPTEEELREGLSELVRSAGRAPDARIVSSLLQIGQNDARWTTLVLRAVDAEPHAAATLNRVYMPQDLIETAGAASPDLRPMIHQATHPSVRAVAFVLGGESESEAAAVLSGPLSPSLLKDVITRTVNRRLFGPTVAAAARSLRPNRQAREDVDVLLWNCRTAALSPAEGLLPGTRLYAPREISGHLVAAYHRIHVRIPACIWSNDEDEFGVVVVSPDAPSVQLTPVPMAFPVQPNGAHLAKRQAEVECVVDGELFMTIASPFSRETWGTDNYLVSFRPPNTWRSWSLRAGGRIHPSPAGVPPKPFCGGHLIVWSDAGVLHFEIDGTPYHLDDWERDKGVERAMAARERTRSTPPAPTVETRWERDLGMAPPADAPRLSTIWANTWKGRQIRMAHAASRHPELAVVVVR